MNNLEVYTLFDSESEVNTTTPAYTAKLGFVTQEIDVGTQKIDGPILNTYRMVIAGFLVQNKLEKVWFFEKTFLLTNTNIKLVLGMLFLTFLDVNIWFVEKSLFKGVTKLQRPCLLLKKLSLLVKKNLQLQP